MGIIMLCLMMALGYAFLPTRAHAVTSTELQAQTDEMNAQLDSMISQTESSIAALRETQSSIEEVQQRIDETRSNLDEKAKEVGQLQNDLAAIIANDYKTRGELGLMNFILGATDYEDLVSRIYYVERVSLQKQKSVEDLVATQDEMMAVQKDLQEKKAGLEELATQQESQVDELQDAVAAQQSYVDSLSAELQAALNAEQVAQLESAQDEADALIEEAENDIDPRNVTPSNNETQSNTSSSESKQSESSSSSSNSSSSNSGSSSNKSNSNNSSSNNNSSNNNSSNNNSKKDTPKSQPSDSNGGNLSDVANYIGPQASWASDAGYISSQQKLLNSAGSSTNWGCVVDKGYGRCIVFRKDGGTWKAAMSTNVITTGHTFTGTFSVVFHARAYWALPDGYDVNDWWVCFIEAWSSDNYSGHLRYEAGKGYDDGQGFHYGYSSGGCTVIPSYSTAQWLYDHVPNGSRVIVH